MTGLEPKNEIANKDAGNRVERDVHARDHEDAGEPSEKLDPVVKQEENVGQMKFHHSNDRAAKD